MKVLGIISLILCLKKIQNISTDDTAYLPILLVLETPRQLESSNQE